LRLWQLPFARLRAARPHLPEANCANGFFVLRIELLTPTTPVIVRMETLRRAAIYASDDALVAKRLFLVVSDRANTAERAGKPDALATFDAGYLAATLQELARLGGATRLRVEAQALTSLVSGVDGYAMVKSRENHCTAATTSKAICVTAIAPRSLVTVTDARYIPAIGNVAAT
jgi:hypothetical protein